MNNVLRVVWVLALSAGVAACTNANSVDAKASASRQCVPGETMGTSDAGMTLVKLCVQSGKISRSFTTEVAASGREQAIGMMFRKSMADNSAMIFPLSPPRQASFWMKNTLIPLDIIFVRSDGSIESIAENAVPYSEDHVVSGEAVAGVLELRGGLTKELGIKAGDVVRWK